MHEAKSQLSKLGEAAWNGETIVIAKSGKPYLELIPYKKCLKKRTPGRFKGQINIPENFNDEVDEINNLFETDLL